MKDEAPQIGTYKVVRAYNETHNNKPMPVAEVYFKKEYSQVYDERIIKIRLRALYNSKSNGPKLQYTTENIAGHELRIKEMVTHTDPIHASKISYSIEWDVLKLRVDLEVVLDSDDPELLNIENDKLTGGEMDEINDPEYLRSDTFTSFMNDFNNKNERRL